MSHQDTVGHTASAPHHQALNQALDWLLELGAALGRGVSRGLHVDTQGPDLRGDPLGLVRREDAHRAVRPGPQDRRGHGDPSPAAGDDLPGLPQDVEGLDRRADRRRWSPPFADACRPTSPTGSRCAASRSSASTAAGWNCPAPRPTSSGFRPPRRDGGHDRNRDAAATPRRGRGRPAPRARAEEGQQPADVADGDVPRRHRAALGLADRAVRQQRARPPAADDRRPARGALVTADAGFVGYEYWKALLDSGRHLLIRVGANVRLLKGLGYVREKDGLVYLWPDREAARDRPPLVLRLVVARGGRHPVYLVTSVLDEAAALGPAGGGDLRPALGSGAVLPPLQADVRAAQAAQPCGGQRRVGGDLVAVGAVGDGPARPGGTGARGRPGAPDQRGRAAACLSAARCASTRAAPTPGNRCANCC